MNCRRFLCIPMLCASVVSWTAIAVGGWKPHEVRHLNGTAAEIRIPAKQQIVTESWNRVVAVPYLVYMPEKQRLLMLVNCDYEHQAMSLTSHDQGATWSGPRALHTGASGKPDAGMSTGLTYLGGGKLLTVGWRSNDYGNTWSRADQPPAANGQPWYQWDPVLVDNDPSTGKVTRLMSFCSDHLLPDKRCQGAIRFSTDEGATWIHEASIPAFDAVDEATFLRAQNGRLVAACRTSNPARFKNEIDHYGGLGVSISKDNGTTWSKPNMLYEYGRHHPSLVLMPSGQIVMTYVVRKGYVDTPDGYPQFGIEAVVSTDQGETWDLDHRYVLAVWPGNQKAVHRWWASSQATSTVLLPDGSLLTAYGTGYRSRDDGHGRSAPRDVGLVHWWLGQEPLSAERTIGDAPFDSTMRNVFDPIMGLPLPRAFDQRLTGKKLRTIFNSDESNVTMALEPTTATAADCRNVIHAILNLGPGVLSQCVGLPDCVIYRSQVATPFNKHAAEVVGGDLLNTRHAKLTGKLHALGTDILQLAVEVCHERGVPLVASYRMNSEDYYDKTYLLSDIGRAHPAWRIPGAGCLDPAIPEVFNYRMKIFREVAEKYDIDGIEFDFRRWFHMVSNPEKNYQVLTRMVRETRQMLDETAKRKGRKKLLLGARVSPSLDTTPNPFVYPGEYYPTDPQNSSCKAIGLDVKTWIKEGLVDYVCPATFIGPLPGLPLTQEFVELTRGSAVGVYPTLWQKSAWMHGVGERWVTLKKEDEKSLAVYKYDLCTTALRMYQDGADGLSTFNWFSHLRDAKVPHNWSGKENAPAGQVDGSFTDEGSDAVQSHIYPLLGDPNAITTYLRQPWALPPRQ
jgi:hypothetical protein